jgi:hypothetical protein
MTKRFRLGAWLTAALFATSAMGGVELDPDAGNKGSGPTNVKATQSQGGNINRQSLDASGVSTTKQGQAGMANQQSATVVNSAAAQSQAGSTNKQTMNVRNGTGSQTQTGSGNTQTMAITNGSATQVQEGMLNTQSIRAGQ